MRKFLKRKLLLVLFLLTTIIMISCSSPEPLKVAVLTKLESGSLTGKTYLDIINYYVNEHDVTEIEFIPFNDGWDPDRIPEVYADIRAQGINIIITRHTSTCAVELKKLTEAELDEVLVIVTSSTTDQLTGIDDNNIRVIQDVAIEQTSIADRILKEEMGNLLIIRDLDNHKYAEPALKYFSERYGDKFELLDISASTVNMTDFENILKKYDFDIVYTLIGANEKVSGVLAQMAWQINPNVKIYFTPWSDMKSIINTAGPSVEQCVIASHFPSKTESPIIENFFNDYRNQLNYIPAYNTFHIYNAVDILNQAVNEGNRTPIEIKNWVMGKSVINTPLGEMKIDEFGDSNCGLYFIEDIIKEYE